MSVDVPRPTTPPSLLLQVGEVGAWVEVLAFGLSAPWFCALPRGDGHPVLVLPGFLADDESTLPLRGVLAWLGYPTYGWDLGHNRGPTDTILDGIEGRLLEVAQRHDQPVSVVGWSLGGLYARELARDFPDAVRLVVTLGTPFHIRPDDRTSASPISDLLSHTWRKDALRMAQDERDKPRLPVPSTSIYTRADGVVRWQLCVDLVDDEHENIEVRATHIGLGFNPAVVVAVADRLAQDAGSWEPFRAPCLLGAWYPRPAVWPAGSAGIEQEGDLPLAV